MRKVLTVAAREYVAAVRTKAFIISLVVMPMMMLGSIVVQVLLEDKVDTTDRRVAVIDHTGRLYDVLATAAAERNERQVHGGEIDAASMPELSDAPPELTALLHFDEENGELRFAGRMSEPQRETLLAACRAEQDRERIRELFEKSQRQARPKYLLEAVDTADGTPAEVRNRQKQRVESREIFAFVEFAADAVDRDLAAGQPAAVYYTARTTYQDLRNWMAGPINQYVRQARLEASELDAAKVAWVTQRVVPRIRHIRSLDETGRHIAGVETNEAAELLMPAALMFLMFMVIMVGATPLVQSVLEEKMQRIAEVLVASIPPFELMLGKLLGVVGVSLTITAVYLIGGYVSIHHYGLDEYVPAMVLGWFILFQALAIIMFGSMFVAIGAACSEMKEAQSSLMPVMLLACLPLFFWLNVVKEPTSSFATLVSLFPPATPMLMTLRLTADPAIALWQPLLGVLLVALTTVACVWAAGRIFRVGVLMQGKGARIGEMLHWVLRG